MTDNDSDATTLEEAALAQRNKELEAEAKAGKTDKQGANNKGILMGSVAAGIGSAALVAALMYARRRK
ncbi:MAG: hypothetical protein BGP16_02085 [Sphingobium sp. 66-54]|nr:MAG: hypothetical protein BGP16_02085 [Sphingobium sp. 66-54]